MSADADLYAPVHHHTSTVDAVCQGCHKHFQYDVNDPFPPYCEPCKDESRRWADENRGIC